VGVLESEYWVLVDVWVVIRVLVCLTLGQGCLCW